MSLFKVWYYGANEKRIKYNDKTPTETSSLTTTTTIYHDGGKDHHHHHHQSVVRLVAALIWASPMLTISSLMGIGCVLNHSSNVTSSIGIAVFVVSVLTAFREYNYQSIVKQRQTQDNNNGFQTKQDQLLREAEMKIVEEEIDEVLEELDEKALVLDVKGDGTHTTHTSNDESTSSSRHAMAVGDGGLSQIRNNDSVMDFGSYSSDEEDRIVKTKCNGLRSILKSKRAEQEFDDSDHESAQTEDSSCCGSSDDGVPLNPTGYISLIPSGSSLRSIHNKAAGREDCQRDQSLLGGNAMNGLGKTSRAKMTLDTTLSTMIQETITQMEESSIRMRSLVIERTERLKRMKFESQRRGQTFVTDGDSPLSPIQLQSLPPPYQNLQSFSDSTTKQFYPPMKTLSIHMDETEDATQLTDDHYIKENVSECGTEFYHHRFPYQTPLTLHHRPSQNSMFCASLGGGGGIIATASMVEEETASEERRDDGPNPLINNANNTIIINNDDDNNIPYVDREVDLIIPVRSDSSAPDDEKREDIILTHVQRERQQGDLNSFVNQMMARNEKGILGMAEEFGNTIHTKLTEEIGPSLHSRFGF
jgi:hypothetical protein